MRTTNECKVDYDDKHLPTYAEVLNNPRYKSTIHERIFWDYERLCFVKFIYPKEKGEIKWS